MKKVTIFSCLVAVLLSLGFGLKERQEDWGFFGHRQINRLAVFTLPSEMIGFYKKNLEFITAHAVDPDKRRYASKFEAVRHYIDADHWGEYPFPNLPRNWFDALAAYTDILAVTSENDTLQLFGPENITVEGKEMVVKGEHTKIGFGQDSLLLSFWDYRKFYADYIHQNYYKEERPLELDSLKAFFPELSINEDIISLHAVDRLSEYGILPWHLLHWKNRLTEAFQKGDATKILRYSTEIGHYLGDAHVPLHTTENYNGQLTNQVGIHGFWESRILELFSDEYDCFVGPADYIDDAQGFFWETILASHVLVDSVLSSERRMRQTFAKDKQMCYEQRNDLTIHTQCEGYCRAFHDDMQGMVEARFTKAIHALGSVWYTAWVDAGQPNLKKLMVKQEEKETEEDKEVEKAYKKGKIFGRKHE